MANCKFFEATGLTGAFCTTPRALHGDEAVVQLNTVGSTDFDLEVQESLDQVNWTTIPSSVRSNEDASSGPFTWKCVKTRYVRICGQVNSGALDVEAFIR